MLMEFYPSLSLKFFQIRKFHFFSFSHDMKVTVLLVFVIFCFSVDANRVSKGILVERESILSNGWNIDGRSSPDMELPFSIAMKQSNLPLLYQKLNEVSNPKSEVCTLDVFSGFFDFFFSNLWLF